uniref:Uncharacterized protein n=1 Tax=Schistocephalus solidus TaxID=70667 RepID=A0A0X3P8U3_SCHSO
MPRVRRSPRQWLRSRECGGKIRSNRIACPCGHQYLTSSDRSDGSCRPRRLIIMLKTTSNVNCMECCWIKVNAQGSSKVMPAWKEWSSVPHAFAPLAGQNQYYCDHLYIRPRLPLTIPLVDLPARSRPH